MNWSTVSFSSPPGDSYQILKGISAVSANDTWAVGYSQWNYFSGYRYAPLTYYWDGTRWSWVPNADGIDEYLFAGAAIPTNDVWVVGENGQTVAASNSGSRAQRLPLQRLYLRSWSTLSYFDSNQEIPS